MAINFNHTSSFNATLLTNNIATTGYLQFPETNQELTLLTSGISKNCITNLNSCLNQISAFKKSNLINNTTSCSVTLSTGNVTTVTGAVLFGNDSQSKLPYEISNAPSNFISNGDAQVSNYVLTGQSSQCSWTTIASIPICTNSLSFIRANIIGKTLTNYFTSFTLDGVIARNTSSSFLPTGEKISGYGSTLDYSIRLYTGTSYFEIQASGGNGLCTYWNSSIKNITLRDTGNQNYIATYFNGSNSSSNWYSLNNWFADSNFQLSATSLPSYSTNVCMLGYTGACANLDCNLWVQPNSIDTTSVTDPKGICLVSANNAIFSGNVYGNVSFYGTIYQ